MILLVIPLLTMSCAETKGVLERDLDTITDVFDQGVDANKLQIVHQQLTLLREQIIENEGYYSRIVDDLYGLRREIGGYEGMDLLLSYFCEDVCPAGGGFVIYYEGVDTLEECAAVGGRAVYSHAWGTQYRFCSPQ